MLEGPGGLVQTAADALNPAETYLLLFKVESRAGSPAGAFDQVFLRAFGGDEPIPTTEENIVWTLAGNTGTDDSSLLDRLAIQVGASAVWSFDELRVGGDFASVAGGVAATAQSVPEPTGLVMPMVLGLAAWMVRRGRAEAGRRDA